MKKWFPEVLVACAILMVVSYSFAQTWTQTSAVAYDVVSIALSSDGSIIMTVGSGTPVVSTNRGITWNSFPSIPPPGSPYGFTQIAMSADGSKVIGNYYGTFCVSMDLANSWYKASLQNCSAIAISKDGSKLFAATKGGSIYESTNSGTNWFSTGAPSKSWSCLAISADGTKLAAGASSDRIYTNSGLTWSATSAPNNAWYFIVASTDGNHLVATGGNSTYISTNMGGNWTMSNIASRAVASSADGRTLVVCTSADVYGNGAQIYTSTNFGLNWTSTNILHRQWFSFASSADGCALVAGENQGIWIYQVSPTPQLSITPSSNNLALSWIIPSTNFVLQQSADLISWSNIPNPPALNLTNLNNELTLAASNTSGFFRLISQ